MSRVLLVDISALVHAHWHIKANEPDPNATSDSVVDRVRQLASGYDHVAICIDSGKSFRCDIDAAYKAHRESKPAAFYHQYNRAVETLEKDGCLALKAQGFEADDVIATSATWLRAQDPPYDIVIATADKDLSQLICDGLTVFSLSKGINVGVPEVLAKFGVKPTQLRDWLSLVGDQSDGVRGIAGVGPKTAADLLGRFGDLAGIYKAIMGKTPEECGVKPAIHKALCEGIGIVDKARALVTLRTDAPIDCAEILKERRQKPLAAVPEAEFEEEDTMQTFDQETGEVQDVPEAQTTTAMQIAEPKSEEKRSADPFAAGSRQMVVSSKWETALEPQNPGQAWKYSAMLFNSRMFNGYGNPESVLSTVLLGRELGLGMMASLRGVHNIKGKHALSADLMAALVINSGKSKYFTPTKLTDEVCTYKTHRIGNPEPMEMSFSVKEAERAGLIKPDSNWLKYPLDMCKARAIARLARAVYPDICFGLYVREELADMREAA